MWTENGSERNQRREEWYKISHGRKVRQSSPRRSGEGSRHFTLEWEKCDQVSRHPSASLLARFGPSFCIGSHPLKGGLLDFVGHFGPICSLLNTRYNFHLDGLGRSGRGLKTDIIQRVVLEGGAVGKVPREQGGVAGRREAHVTLRKASATVE